jgi:PAS domain-containing protein
MSHPIQIILIRQLAAYLSVPLFLFDPKGNLLFYNEPAEAMLSRRFDETGAMSADEWWSAFDRSDDEGKPVRREDHPLMITLTEMRPTSMRFNISGLDGVAQRIDSTTIPITGLQGDLLGAVALFWELSE